MNSFEVFVLCITKFNFIGFFTVLCSTVNWNGKRRKCEEILKLEFFVDLHKGVFFATGILDINLDFITFRDLITPTNRRISSNTPTKITTTRGHAYLLGDVSLDPEFFRFLGILAVLSNPDFYAGIHFLKNLLL